MLTSYAAGRLFAERVGTGAPCVVALHGWRRDRHDLVPALGGLAAVSLDLPGFGASPVPPEAWGSADYAAFLAPVLDDLVADSGPLVVLGHSFGGRVAVHLAASRPDLVRGLVLTGVPLLRRAGAAPGPALSFRVARALNRRGLLPDARMAALRTRRGSADYQAATGVMRDVLVRVINESYDDQLRATACPVRLVWGENDTAAPVAVAREAGTLLARSTLQVLPGVDHFVPTRDPASLGAAVRSLLPAESA